MEPSDSPAGPVRRRRPNPPTRRVGDRVLFTLTALTLSLALVIVILTGAALVYLPRAADAPAAARARTPAAPTARPTPRLAERAATIRSEWAWRTITLDAGFKTWTVSPEQLGLRLDVEGTAAQFVGAGQPASPGLLVTQAGEAFVPAWEFDLRVAEATLQKIAAEIEIKPQNAGLRIVGARLEATPGQPGRALDLRPTLTVLAHNPWAVVYNGRLALEIIPVEPAIGDVGLAMAKAGPWLAAPVVLNLYDAIQDEKLSWSIAPEVLASWIQIGPAKAAPTQLDCTVEPAGVEAYLQAQMAELGAERYLQMKEAAPAVIAAMTGTERTARARIYHRPRRHTVKAGETLSSIALDYGMPYPWIARANPALGDLLRAGQVITIPSTDDLAPLPPVENKRIVVSLAKQRVWVFEDDMLKWEWIASTGLPESPTSPGVFQIQSHEPNAYASKWDLWMPWFMGVYRPVPGDAFMNGFHGFPSRGGQQFLWQGNLGAPITYGCILISTANAKLLYDWAEDGVMVVIRRD